MLESKPAQLAFAGLWLSFALLPFGSSYEIGVLCCWGAVALSWWQGRTRNRSKPIAYSPAALSLVAWVFGGYLLAALLALPDAVAPERSFGNALGLFRLLGLPLAALLLSSQQLARLLKWLALVAAIWVFDALVQALFGYGLRGASDPDRLSGIFGENLKLGPVLALSAPILLWALRERPRWQLLGLLLLLCSILLAGTRAGWIMFVVVIACWMEQVRQRRKWALWRVALGTLLVAPALALLLYSQWPSFAARMDRTMLLLSGDREQIDEALAFRLPIWETAGRMALAHPWNGVGTRGFRDAYVQYAAPDDRWAAQGGAFHPHHIALEILCETGLLGLTCWLLAALALFRAYHAASVQSRMEAWPYTVALLAMTFPLNTHLAFYSSFWSVPFALILALLIANLSQVTNLSQGTGESPAARQLAQAGAEFR